MSCIVFIELTGHPPSSGLSVGEFVVGGVGGVGVGGVGVGCTGVGGIGAGTGASVGFNVGLLLGTEVIVTGGVGVPLFENVGMNVVPKIGCEGGLRPPPVLGPPMKLLSSLESPEPEDSDE